MRSSAIVVIAALMLAPSCARSQDADTVTTPRDPNLPPGEESAKAALDASPRHGEFVDIVRGEGQAPIRTWIVYPERKDKAGVVLLIHEIYGLSDWMRGVADQLARDGFIAVAPDLISGLGPGGGGTDSVASRDDVVKLVRGLTPEETQARLDAVRAYAMKLPAATGKVATMGFCWGGARSFGYAASEPPIQAAVVFYGTSPEAPRCRPSRRPCWVCMVGTTLASTRRSSRRALRLASSSGATSPMCSRGRGTASCVPSRDAKARTSRRPKRPGRSRSGS